MCGLGFYILSLPILVGKVVELVLLILTDLRVVTFDMDLIALCISVL
jgi:hypothetical protein